MRKERSDKGRKRLRYVQSKRRFKKEMRDLRNTLNEIDKGVGDFDAVAAAERKRKHRALASGDSRKRSAPLKVDGRTATVNERRRFNRESMLPMNRICPRCGKFKYESKKWVADVAAGICCKSCFTKLQIQLATVCNVDTKQLSALWKQFIASKVDYSDIQSAFISFKNGQKE